MRKHFLILLIGFLFSNTLVCQEKKNSISLCGTLNRTAGIDDFRNQHFEGYNQSSLMPGLEIGYWRRISSRIECGTGLNFKNSRISSNADTYFDAIFRFKQSEVSIPILSKWKISMKNQNYWYVTTGVYCGLQFDIKSEIPVSGGWKKIEGLKDIEGYSGDHFFADLYIDGGYAKSLKKIGTLSISPFLLIRANETWLSIYQNRIQYGVKLAYSFKF